MEISLEEIAEILKFIDTLDCASVEVTIGDVHLAVRKRGDEASPPMAFAGLAPGTPARQAASAVGVDDADRSPEATAPEARPDASRNGMPGGEWLDREARGEIAFVRSPMVGTLYRRKEPGAPPFVEVGDSVDEGDVLCLVEVMKLFHSLTAEAEGVVEAIFVDDGAMVEFSQPLMAIAKT